MAQTFTLREAARLADLPSYRELERRIADRLFEPRHKPRPPEPRRFELGEIFRLGVAQELRSLGVPLESAFRATHALPRVDRGPTLLVLWLGQHKFADDLSVDVANDGSRTLTPADPFCGPFSHYADGILDYGSRTIEQGQLQELAGNPEVRGLIVVNLDASWARLQERLAALGSKPHAEQEPTT